MRLLSWFRHRTARRSRPARPPRKLRLEGLEDRFTPSGGLLDPTFGFGGIVNLPSTTDNLAVAVAVQPDGKIVVAGEAALTTRNHPSCISVQRLNRDGSLDTTFNQTGSITILSGIGCFSKSVVFQPDGKILIGGGATTNKGVGQSLVARLNANGTLDSTFGSKGLWLANGGQVKKLVVLTDPAHPSTVTGIVGGAEDIVNNTAYFEAIKLTPAGRSDTTFGSGGFTVLTNLSGAVLNSMAVDRASGEIYLAGILLIHNTDGSSTDAGALAAVTPAGASDPQFGSGAGYVVDALTGDDGVDFNDVAIQTLIVNGQPTSRIVVVGQEYFGPINPSIGIVVGYTPTGALDASFGTGGTFSTLGVAGISNNIDFSSLALAADGSIVVGGGDNNSGGMLVGHLTADGAVDTSFGPDGTGFTHVQDGQISPIWSVAIDPIDGSIVTGGYSYQVSNSPRQAAVARFTAP